MDYIDRFKTRMNVVGGSIRGERIKNNINLIHKTFEDDTSYCDHLYFWQHGKNKAEDYDEEDSFGVRLYGRKFSAANGTTMSFQSEVVLPISIGDIIFVSKLNEFWICTESFLIDDIVYQGELTKCNWMLKWQNDNGDILEYPSYVINSTQYNSGETLGKILTFGSAQHQATLPCDENTLAIRTPKRFYLDKNTDKPVSFVVTQNDNVTYNYGNKGIVKITFLQSVSDNEHDRPDLGICDYIDKEAKDDFNQESDVRIVYDKNVIKSGGEAQTFNVQFYTDNVFDVVWNIVGEFNEVLQIVNNGNSIQIAIDDDDYIDMSFRLELQNSLGNVLDYVVVKVESLL